MITTRSNYCGLFGDNLCSILEEMGIGVAEASRRTGVSTSSLYNYLDPIDDHLPDIYTLYKISEGLGYSFNDLLDVV